MQSLQVLNIFQVNIKKIIVLRHRIKTTRNIFANKFTYPSHRYLTYTKNIKYLKEELHFGTRFCQALRKNFKNLFYLK